MDENYTVLPFVGKLLKTLGLHGVLAGVVMAITLGIIEPLLSGFDFGTGDFLDIAAGFVVVLLSLVAIAFGEIVGVLFAIEVNTRQASLSKTTRMRAHNEKYIFSYLGY